jgi:nicotinate-nucleotide adenylyltransferase
MKEFTPIGVLGGTFDPIHHGHLRLAEEAGQNLNLQHIRFIPSGNPTHREQPCATAEHRSQMVRLAIGNNSLFKLDERELGPHLSGYMVDTLQALKTELGADYALCLLLGADAFLNLTAWSRWEQLFELAHIIVARRPGFDVEAKLSGPLKLQWQNRLSESPAVLKKQSAGIIMMQQITLLDIAASRIRELLREKLTPRYLLPQEVLDYIYRHKLYS